MAGARSSACTSAPPRPSLFGRLSCVISCGGGSKGVKLVISDAHEGLKAAIQRVVGATVDNEHQSSCGTTGCRGACSAPTPTLSITAATPGTGSSTSLGSSCPSASGIGPMHDDQRGLVLSPTWML